MALTKFAIRLLIIGIVGWTSFSSAAQKFCNNLDFENSASGPLTSSTQITGWLINDGSTSYVPNPPPASNTLAPYFPSGKQYNNSCNLSSCCPLPPLTSEIIDCSAPSGFIDSIIGPQYPIFSIFGSQAASAQALNAYKHLNFPPAGTRVIRLNNRNIGDYSIALLKRKFTVTGSDSAFKYAYLLVGQPGHQCCSSPGAVILFYDITGSTPVLLSELSKTISVGTGCTQGECYSISGTGLPATPDAWSASVYSKWRVNYVDLRHYKGKAIEMQLYTLDCDAGGHYGYMYFDADCGLSPYVHQYLSITGQTISPGDTVTIHSCLTTPTLTVNGFFSTWSMNGGYSNGSSMSPISSGTIKLTFNKGCGQVAKEITIFLTISDSLKISPQNTLICAGSSLSLTTNAASGVIWGNGDTVKTIIVSPLSTALYTVTGTISNCTHSAVAVVSVAACSGIVTEDGTRFNAYPNPTNQDLRITYPEIFPDAVIVLENFLGQTLLTHVCRQNCLIDVTQLPPGIYIAKLYAGGRLQYTTRILVKPAKL